MTIRKATTKDIKEIVRIFREGYSEEPYNGKWSEEITNNRIKKYMKTEEVFVLEEDKKIKGFIIFSIYEWHTGLRGFISELVVEKLSRGKGHGKELLKFAEKFLKDKGTKEVQLVTLPASKAYQMYKKLNYHDEGYVTMYKKI